MGFPPQEIPLGSGKALRRTKLKHKALCAVHLTEKLNDTKLMADYVSKVCGGLWPSVGEDVEAAL